jgi:hypothetical protein
MEEESLEESLTELAEDLRHLVRIREAEVLASIRRLTNVHATDDTQPREIEVNGFKKGDRVRITKKVEKSAVWPRKQTWVESEFRLATVTKVSSLQVHFLTDNGVRTWRAPNNLERVAV